MFTIEYFLKIKTSNDSKLFTKYDGDAGLDIFNPKSITIPAKSQGKIFLGIYCELTKVTSITYEDGTKWERSGPASFFLLPRSSISKTPLRMSNSIGLIDSGYRGELIAVVDNISDEDYIVEKDTRLFQIVNADLTHFTKVVQVNELSSTKRGIGGFGSTGK